MARTRDVIELGGVGDVILNREDPHHPAGGPGHEVRGRGRGSSRSGKVRDLFNKHSGAPGRLKFGSSRVYGG